MLNFILLAQTRLYPKTPITLEVGEIEDYDFDDCSEQIFKILEILEVNNLIDENPYIAPEEVSDVIQNLIDDIDLDSDKLQISEKWHVRVEFRDELLSVEVFIGV